MNTLINTFTRSVADKKMNVYTYNDIEKLVDDPTKIEYLEDLISDYCENDIFDKATFLLCRGIKPYCYPIFPSVEMCRLLCKYKIYPDMKLLSYWIETNKELLIIELLKFKEFSDDEVILISKECIKYFKIKILTLFKEEICQLSDSQQNDIERYNPICIIPTKPPKRIRRNIVEPAYVKGMPGAIGIVGMRGIMYPKFSDLLIEWKKEYKYNNKLKQKYGRKWYYKWFENSSNPNGCPKYINDTNPKGLGTQFLKFKKEAELLYKENGWIWQED